MTTLQEILTFTTAYLHDLHNTGMIDDPTFYFFIDMVKDPVIQKEMLNGVKSLTYEDSCTYLKHHMDVSINIKLGNWGLISLIDHVKIYSSIAWQNPQLRACIIIGLGFAALELSFRALIYFTCT